MKLNKWAVIIPALLGVLMVVVFDTICKGQEPFASLYNLQLLMYGFVIGWMWNYEEVNY